MAKLVGNELHGGRITYSSSEGSCCFKARSVVFMKNIFFNTEGFYRGLLSFLSITIRDDPYKPFRDNTAEYGGVLLTPLSSQRLDIVGKMANAHLDQLRALSSFVGPNS